METLSLEIHDSIATIVLNRASEMNALNQTMLLELQQVTEQLALDNSVRVVIIRGNGPCFMAGGDIKMFAENMQQMPIGVQTLVRSFAAVISQIRALPKPVIAAVHGAVAGGGLALMLACDLVMAAQKTKFTTAYLNLGITPDGGMAYHLTHIVGKQKALELLLLAERFEADEALRLHLINKIVTEEELMPETLKLATRLAEGPTSAYGRAKTLVNRATETSLNTILELEAHAFAACTAEDNFKEGVSAFLQKRIPQFS